MRWDGRWCHNGHHKFYSTFKHFQSHYYRSIEIIIWEQEEIYEYLRFHSDAECSIQQESNKKNLLPLSIFKNQTKII